MASDLAKFAKDNNVRFFSRGHRLSGFTSQALRNEPRTARRRFRRYPLARNPNGNDCGVRRSVSFPNIAVIQWTLKKGALGENQTFDKAMSTAITRLYTDRGTVDISSALWSWLGFV